MKTRTLTKSEVKPAPYLVWNAFIDLLATEEYADLSVEQRAAQLVFWYESEVQNGGHLQYFENQAMGHLANTVEALNTLGAECQRQILKEAGALWLARKRPRSETADQFCAIALAGEFDEFDRRFHQCKPTLVECLEDYLKAHLDSFVTVK
jgi:hypothetical protein